jgi:micrococcal nuclease
LYQGPEPKSEQKKESVTEPVQTEPVQTEPSLGCSGNAKCITGKVTKITDGDTIKVNGESIRFALISAPELGKSGGIEARDYIEQICPVGSKVIVDEDDGQINGSHGRTIAEIYCKGISLNESILKEKLAKIYTEFCSVSEFSNESWAQEDCATINQATSQQIPKETPKSTDDPNDCEISYPDFCIHPSPTDLDCKDVLPYKKFTVRPPDPYEFDRDHDGIGCEG